MRSVKLFRQSYFAFLRTFWCHKFVWRLKKVCNVNILQKLCSNVIIHGQAKKIIWGSNSQGTTQKICRPPSAAGKFFRQPCRPRVQNDQNFFTHGIPMVYSQGSFISTFLPGLTTQGSFLRFFLIFSEFSWFFPIFHEFLPKNLPAAFGGQKFFPPLGSWPLPKFFYP